ncbi:hypothetical protein E1B28_011124 [Marasmius oreades]|uniref:Galactose oxidase n=1 Tax=Marasmius oreades TaxID=181124 RepID=A0A9P7RTF1_9AGAR|nr:uncharacterized protein E1B28_011124 [Marasmius oreades]KAG7089439.1 hypothetical protein E1B28_011124 [Marasmius oreades]
MKLPRLIINLVIVNLILSYRASAYTATPRWGQATALVNDALFVHGGFSDPSNAYSYTSAPIINDLLYLPLSSSFDISDPPWVLISSSSNSSTKPGPALAWHTLSPVNTTEILLFGGLPAISSPTVLTLRADSAWWLNIFNRLVPSWWQGPMSWADEPIRRIHHTATTTTKGLVIIVGGERADGSKITFSEHYLFDPNAPSFTQLSATNSPPGITGHVAILLPDGRLLVFGGVNSQTSDLISFSTIWVLDTSSMSWALLAVATDTLPNPRRAFAAVLIAGEKIVIHGGSDATFQTTYSDGWILDTTQNPATWTQIDSLNQLGGRRDHYAVSSGDQVIFGFGYGAFGPSTAGPIVWKPSDGSFPTTYSPPSPSSVTRTLPGPTQTSDSNHPNHSGGGGGTGNPSGTSDPNQPTTPPLNGDDNNKDKAKKTTAIAVGTIVGALALLAGGVLVVYYVRRKGSSEGQRFSLLNEDDPDISHMAGGAVAAYPFGDKAPSGAARWRPIRSWNVGGALTAVPAGIIGIAGARRTQQRRDMLADEDTREFGWNDWRGKNNSSWSIMSIMKGSRTRQPSHGSYSSYANLGTGTPRREKSDPFSDGASLLRDDEIGFVGAAAPGQGTTRPSTRREISHASARSSWSYIDPFADPIPEEYTDIPESSLPKRPRPEPTQPLTIQTVLPSVREVHVLSPVTEASRGSQSQSDLTSTQSSYNHSNDHSLTPLESGSRTSQTSYNPTLYGQRPSSLIDSSSSQPVRRSDSWWSRFSRTAFLDRRGSGSRHGGMYDIRDPNPPPRLVPIEENQNSGSAGSGDSPGSKRANSVKRALSRRGSRMYTAGHGKSISSIQTANTDALERVAGMDVVQRERTGSDSRRESSGSYESSWITEDSGPLSNVAHGVDMSFSLISPAEMTYTEASADGPSPSVPPPVAKPPSKNTPSPPLSPSSSGTSLSSPPPRPTSGSAVAARVEAYERRMSQSEETKPVTTGKRRHSATSYGLAPRPSLFVANPDHSAGPPED